MTRLVRIPDELFARLQAHGKAFVDTEADVIQRLLDFYEAHSRASDGSKVRGESAEQEGRDPGARTPRERGATVEIGRHVIQAASVGDLYEQALKVLLDNGHANRLNELIPFKTSGERYLIAERPVHPNGKPFFNTVRYKGYYMEAHKDYRNAIRHLAKLVEKCGLRLRYLG